MKKPKLSICIPTFNRPAYVKKAIDSIINQEPYRNGQVEIVISDNSRNDGTRRLVEQYAENGIRYFKNDDDTGNMNQPLALSRGAGVYRKLSNDTVYFQQGALDEMIRIINENICEEPIILWKTYSFRGTDYAETEQFDEVIYLCSIWTTWISAYGIWEDEAKSIMEYHKGTTEEFKKRIIEEGYGGDVNMKVYSSPEDIKGDSFWQLRYLGDMFRKKKKIILTNSARNWISDNPPKYYSKGRLKWLFHDYFLDILREFEDKGMLSRQDIDIVERDLGFSFFISFMVDIEFPSLEITYDKDDTLIKDILDEYRRKPYYEELYNYYLERREKKH